MDKWESLGAGLRYQYFLKFSGDSNLQLGQTNPEISFPMLNFTHIGTEGWRGEAVYLMAQQADYILPNFFLV